MTFFVQGNLPFFAIGAAILMALIGGFSFWLVIRTPAKKKSNLQQRFSAAYISAQKAHIEMLCSVLKESAQRNQRPNFQNGGAITGLGNFDFQKRPWSNHGVSMISIVLSSKSALDSPWFIQNSGHPVLSVTIEPNNNGVPVIHSFKAREQLVNEYQCSTKSVGALAVMLAPYIEKYQAYPNSTEAGRKRA